MKLLKELLLFVYALSTHILIVSDYEIPLWVSIIIMCIHFILIVRFVSIFFKYIITLVVKEKRKDAYDSKYLSKGELNEI